MPTSRMASTAPELGVAQLCASCQRAVWEDRFYPAEEELHEILSPKEAASYGSRPCIPTWYSLDEQLPELLKLDASARQGCDFCRFLRDIILLETPTTFWFRSLERASQL
jgi:hypothetical protein